MDENAEDFTFAPSFDLTNDYNYKNEELPKAHKVVPAMDKYLERMKKAKESREAFRAATERGVPAPKKV
jgi:hypothetical protein